jgi:hypothetical protein
MTQKLIYLSRADLTFKAPQIAYSLNEVEAKRTTGLRSTRHTVETRQFGKALVLAKWCLISLARISLKSSAAFASFALLTSQASQPLAFDPAASLVGPAEQLLNTPKKYCFHQVNLQSSAFCRYPNFFAQRFQVTSQYLKQAILSRESIRPSHRPFLQPSDHV